MISLIVQHRRRCGADGVQPRHRLRRGPDQLAEHGVHPRRLGARGAGRGRVRPATSTSILHRARGRAVGAGVRTRRRPSWRWPAGAALASAQSSEMPLDRSTTASSFGARSTSNSDPPRTACPPELAAVGPVAMLAVGAVTFVVSVSLAVSLQLTLTRTARAVRDASTRPASGRPRVRTAGAGLACAQPPSRPSRPSSSRAAAAARGTRPSRERRPWTSRRRRGAVPSRGSGHRPDSRGDARVPAGRCAARGAGPRAPADAPAGRRSLPDQDARHSDAHSRPAPDRRRQSGILAAHR